MFPLDPDGELVTANPRNVHKISAALSKALFDMADTEDTTQADVLSALFTTLRNMLLASKHVEDPKDHDNNAREIGRVLMDLLVEFGTPANKMN